MTLLLAVFISNATSVHAAITCAPAHLINDPNRKVAAHVLKVNQVDDADRKVAKDFATDNHTDEATIKRRYAATGDLVCNGTAVGQANVSVVGDVITTAAHVIFGRGGCGREKQKFPKCKLVSEIDGEKKEVEVDGLINSGWICGTGENQKSPTDWAVLKLKRKVDPRIKPYPLGPDLKDADIMGLEVTSVAKSQDFPKTSNEDLASKPRHYGNCKGGGLNNFDFAMSLQTNCDVYYGSSGGALLTRGPEPSLLGVHANMAERKKSCPAPRGTKESGPMTDCWSNSTPLITSDFRTTLLGLKDEESPRPSTPPAAPSSGGTDL